MELPVRGDVHVNGFSRMWTVGRHVLGIWDYLGEIVRCEIRNGTATLLASFSYPRKIAR